MQFAPAGEKIRNLGVLLYDGINRRLLMRFREDYGFATEEDAEVLSALGADLTQKANESDDPIHMIRYFEDTLSNDLRISVRSIIKIEGDPNELLNAIYLKHIEIE